MATEWVVNLQGVASAPPATTRIQVELGWSKQEGGPCLILHARNVQGDANSETVVKVEPADCVPVPTEPGEASMLAALLVLAACGRRVRR